MTEAAFLRDICEHPRDDAPRLVFADWLEDNGQSERAEFIRLEIKLDSFSPTEWQDLRRRHQELFFLYDAVNFGGMSFDFWSGIGVRPGIDWFRRGFIHAVTLPIAAFLRHAKALFAVHPIEEVRLSDREPMRTTEALERYPPLWCWSPERPTWDDMPARLPDSLFLRLSGFRTDLDHGWYSSAWRFYDTREEALTALSRACVAWGRRQAGLPPLEAV